ncbi:MAG: flagellar type III secretion system protein FlhB [Marinovum sp.]|nr:flagellar type III secretion system protein FlhB [Marinovum sp.]
MADDSDASDKSFEASQKKLDDARRKGDFPRSSDLNATAMYLGFIITGLAVGGDSLLRVGEALSAFLSMADPMATRVFAGAARPVIGLVIEEIVKGLLPFVIVPFALVALSVTGQRGWVFALNKLEPKLSRISVVENAKNKFGARGLFEFAKSTLKLGLFSWLLFTYLTFRFDALILAIHGSVQGSIVQLLNYCIEFLAIVFALSIVISAIDYGWQQFDHLRKQRMSQKELRDEMKEAEGDPYLKQARRSKAEQIAMNAMLADVPDADVIIVNPTHYAVALKWSRMPGSAPECLAKGVDEIAMRIREIASEHNVPIHSDPPTARALFAAIEIGQEVEPDHYQAVAAAIRFSDAMRAKAKGRVT